MPKTSLEMIFDIVCDSLIKEELSRLKTLHAGILDQEDQIKSLKKLRDDLHLTTNKYLERARKAEQELDRVKKQRDILRRAFIKTGNGFCFAQTNTIDNAYLGKYNAKKTK